MVYTFYQVKEESIKIRFDGKIIKGMMDILSGQQKKNFMLVAIVIHEIRIS